MARQKKPVHKVQMTDGKRSIIQQLLQEYDIQSAEDIQNALKDLLGGTIKEMMETEMVTNPNASTAAMAAWIFRSPRIASQLLSHRWLKNGRKIFLTLTTRSFLCMQKA